MFHIPRLSEAVYVGLCHRIGSPTEVRVRREVMNTVEFVKKPVQIMRGSCKMLSGSRREGFRLCTTDDDFMLWIPDHKVICDLSQISLYRASEHTVILMECDGLPPGFTRLKLMSATNHTIIKSSCVVMNNKVYISSVLFRENHLRFLQKKDSSAFPHGPCSTLFIFQDAETDFAFCLSSHHWPTKALPWIQRCRQQGWPLGNIVSDVVTKGFHVIPIGSTHENGEEWRILFSQAEQKLVYSMNHCQFLCYGLLKIFLKEVINSQTNTPVLCSYFIKTTVFWVIQTNISLTWTPDELLSCFWECFKLLIYWVHSGVCPNFFIPQNNMFRLKVTGSVQTSLFSQLHDLYCKGISCLLLSQTLRPYLSHAILNRTLGFGTDESSIISSTWLDFKLFHELKRLSICIFRIEEFVVYMKQLEKMIRGKITVYQEVTLQRITSEVLRNTAMFRSCSIHPKACCNKAYYKQKNISALLKRSCTFGCVSDILYPAMYFYRTRMHEHSLSCLQKAQERITLPYVMYTGKVNLDLYRHCLMGMSLNNRIRKAMMDDIMLDSAYIYIDELVLEQKISRKNRGVFLFIPPLVILYMLLILNHHRMGDIVRSRKYLRDLLSLLLYDNEVFVPARLRDISWQILGICQQVCGDYMGSLTSYRYSLQQRPYHKIQEVTMFRMNTLLYGAI